MDELEQELTEAEAYREERERQERRTTDERIALDRRRVKITQREKRRALIREAKDRPCADCGQRFPLIAMDFDHVRGYKVATISSMANRNFPLRKIREEIGKCEVVCANCHRIRHSRETPPG